MNPFDMPIDDDSRFDRLVDGEMSELERRGMLAALDDEPGGWRRCALAFLEAQAWRQSMPEIRPLVEVTGDLSSAATGHTKQQGCPATGKQPRAGAKRANLVRLALAMAACFLLAFFLGSEFRQRISPGQQPRSPLARLRTPDIHDVVAEPPTETFDSPSPRPVIPWGEATFVMDGDEAEVDVPIFDLDPEARQMLLENSTAAIDNLRQDLLRRGYDVQRDVRWSPVEMGGGQKMFVPIGDIVISPISHRAIQ